jgi:hypothetical protein
VPVAESAPISSATTGWTVETIKAHFDQRFIDSEKAVGAALAAAEKAVNTAFASAEKAVEKSEMNADKWRASANEWRDAMNDREVKFASRTEVATEFDGLNKALLALKESFGKEIQALQHAQAAAIGTKAGATDAQRMVTWILGLIVGAIVVGGAVVGVAMAIRTAP